MRYGHQSIELSGQLKHDGAECAHENEILVGDEVEHVHRVVPPQGPLDAREQRTDRLEEKDARVKVAFVQKKLEDGAVRVVFVKGAVRQRYDAHDVEHEAEHSDPAVQVV